MKFTYDALLSRARNRLRSVVQLIFPFSVCKINTSQNFFSLKHSFYIVVLEVCRPWDEILMCWHNVYVCHTWILIRPCWYLHFIINALHCKLYWILSVIYSSRNWQFILRIIFQTVMVSQNWDRTQRAQKNRDKRGARRQTRTYII